jgi:hypothetical protein
MGVNILQTRELDLYQYFPLSRLESIFERGLCFTVAANFTDKSEGRFPPAHLSALDERIEATAKQLRFPADEVTVNNTKDVLAAQLRALPARMFVRCLHENSEFSECMWNEYATGGGQHSGAFMLTTKSRVVASLDRRAFQFLHRPRGGGFWFTRVDYERTFESMPDQEICDAVLDMSTFGIKENKYAREQEQRLIFDASMYSVLTGRHLNGSGAVQGLGFSVEDADEFIRLDPIESGLVPRLFVRVDPTVLFKSIGVAGKDADSVRSLCDKHGVACQVFEVHS